MYIVYTLRTILRFDGIGDWPAGKSAFNCPATADMNFRALRGRVPTLGTNNPVAFEAREFGISTLPPPPSPPIRRSTNVARLAFTAGSSSFVHG